jgi:hypothetical protein
MPQNAVIIDAATRFLRSNPELLQFARRGAGETGQGVEDLLTDAVRRIRRSGFEAISEEQVVVGPPHRGDRRPRQRPRSRRPGVDDPRPRLVVIATGDTWRDGQEQLLNSTVRQQAAEQ